MTNQTPDSSELFKDAGQSGELSPGSVSILSGLSARINRSMSLLTVNPTVTDQTQLCMLLDNTPSMECSDNHKAVIDGHNQVVNALIGAKAVNSVESLTMLINPCDKYAKRITGDSGTFQWGALKAAPRLDASGFISGHSTPLYDRCLETLGSVVARTKWWEDNYGIQTRSVTLLMTDGCDNSSTATKRDVAGLVRDMLAMEKHKVFFMGVKLRGVNFTKIGMSMGIPKECINVVERDEKAIRAKFQLFSQSAISVASNTNAVSGLGFQ